MRQFPGVDFSWHIGDGDEIVIDRWEIGGEPAEFDPDTFNLIWPSWMIETAKKSTT